jgi:hypothetical protein
MSVTTPDVQPGDVARRPFRVSRVGVVFLGVIVVPVALGAILNSYGALTDSGAVRMAFATVAGQTIAILSAVAIVVITLLRRLGAAQIALVVVVAAVITVSAISIMSSASDVLLTRIYLVR